MLQICWFSTKLAIGSSDKPNTAKFVGLGSTSYTDLRRNCNLFGSIDHMSFKVTFRCLVASQFTQLSCFFMHTAFTILNFHPSLELPIALASFAPACLLFPIGRCYCSQSYSPDCYISHFWFGDENMHTRSCIYYSFIVKILNISS